VQDGCEVEANGTIWCKRCSERSNYHRIRTPRGLEELQFASKPCLKVIVCFASCGAGVSPNAACLLSEAKPLECGNLPPSSGLTLSKVKLPGRLVLLLRRGSMRTETWFPGSAGVSPATASRKSAFLSKQSNVNNKSSVSDKLGRRDGGAPREAVSLRSEVSGEPLRLERRSLRSETFSRLLATDLGPLTKATLPRPSA